MNHRNEKDSVCEGKSEHVRAADLEGAFEVWLVADHDFTLAVIIADNWVVDEVDFAIFSNDSYTVASGPNRLCLD
jgi:hypothetical protein